MEPPLRSQAWQQHGDHEGTSEAPRLRTCELFRISRAATTESLTETQRITGRLPYMSSEPVRGEGPDSGGDIYSVGTVRYEMATRRRPFEAKSSTTLIDDSPHKIPQST